MNVVNENVVIIIFMVFLFVDLFCGIPFFCFFPLLHFDCHSFIFVWSSVPGGGLQFLFLVAVVYFSFNDDFP